MRGPRTALIAAVVVTGVSATILKAQQMFGGSARVAAPAGSGAGPAASDPSLATRSARQLLKNGLDYLNTYQDYDRALHYLSEAEPPVGLSDQELEQLRAGLEQARNGQASPVTADARPSVSRGSVPTRRPARCPWPRRPAVRRASTSVRVDPACLRREGRARRAALAGPAELPRPRRRAPPPADAPKATGPSRAPPVDKPVAPPTDMPAPPPAEPIFLTASGPDRRPRRSRRRRAGRGRGADARSRSGDGALDAPRRPGPAARRAAVPARGHALTGARGSAGDGTGRPGFGTRRDPAPGRTRLRRPCPSPSMHPRQSSTHPRRSSNRRRLRLRLRGGLRRPPRKSSRPRRIPGRRCPAWRRCLDRGPRMPRAVSSETREDLNAAPAAEADELPPLPPEAA